ncbi:MAG: LPS-assembly protein LptD [Candidatus Rokubacteria bacterium]|nr:LPS-assembly protein LptD [Candidatus Rokubacteria bacterium]MBI3827546.1 LPS-assembly protein LptD [Candidatus Rokubacteria bacterium]
MTRFRSAVVILAGLVLVGPSVASAQITPPLGVAPPTSSPGVPAAAAPPAPVTVTTSAGDVTVIADRMEEVAPSNLVVATGNVEVTKGTTRLTADRVEINRESGDTVAVGRPLLYDGQDRLTGDRIDYNLKTGSGVIHHGEVHTSPYYRIAGERLERLGEGVYRIRRGIFTTCEDDPPTWSFRAADATADLEAAIYGTNASLWVKNVPVVPYLPFFAAALRRERQTGFLAPRFGDSSRKGAFTEIPFFWAISDSQDATVTLDAYQKRGVGLNLEYRNYFSSTDKLEATGFFIHESEVRGTLNRGWWGLKDSDVISPGFVLKADINGVSDDAIFQDYADRLHFRSAQRVESNVFLTKSFPTWNVVGNLFWYQDLTTRRPIELYRLPDLRAEAVRQPVPIPGLQSFLYEGQASAVRFVRELGSDGTRLDLHPRLSRPISLQGFATVTPFVGLRTTSYDRTVVGERTTADGATVEKTRDEVRTRALSEIGADFETRASRIFDVGGAGNIDAILHTIEPRVNYTWVEGTTFKHLPLWTPGVDDIQPSSTFTYSLTNRLRARTVAPEGTEPARWELARFVLSQTANMESTARTFGPVTADLIVDPNRIFRFRATGSVDPYGHGHAVQSTTTDLFIRYDPIVASIGTRASQPDKVNFLQGGLTAEINRYLVGRFTTNWDLRTDTFLENRVGVDARFDCYALTVEVVTRNKSENEIRFALTLLGVGSPLASGTKVGPGGFGAGTTGAENRLR